jgi:hypothetical protein
MRFSARSKQYPNKLEDSDPQKRETIMSIHSPRMTREKKTIDAMIKIYCNDHHNTGNEICTNCQELFEYAKTRLEKCPFQENKPTCAKCLIHCYNSSMRITIRDVMRHSGPRMLFKHPVLALHHLLDRFKKPEKAQKSQG